MLCLVCVNSTYGSDTSPSSPIGGIKRGVYLEALENKEKENTPADHFCEEMKGQSHQLEEHCNSFSEQSCKYSSCCVYASVDGEDKCMAGNKDGPTFGRNDDGTMKDIEYYYFKRKCYGDKCHHEK